MKLKWKPVLAEEEIKELLKVPTTVDMAEQIIKRNMAALHAVRKLDRGEGLPNGEGVIHIGCPHCIHVAGRGFRCSRCPYIDARGGKRDIFACCQYSFGGIKFEDVQSHVSLYHNSMSVYGFDGDGRRPTRSKREKIKRWLRGHVEWGMIVKEMEEAKERVKMVRRAKRGRTRKK